MKAIFALLALAIISISSVSAITTTLNANYQRSETMLARIDGQITNNLNTGNVEFKRGTVRVPLEFDIKKLGTSYYIWAVASDSEGSYTMYIYNIMTSGEQQPITFSQNFTVSGNRSDYTIKPGFVITSGNFSIDVTLHTDTAEDITTDFPSSRTIHLVPGDNTVTYSVTGVTIGLHTASLGVYDVPVYMTTGSPAPINQTNSTNSTENNTSGNGTVIQPGIILVVTPSSLSKLALFGGMPSYGFALYNNGNESVDDIKFIYNTNLMSIEPDDSVSLDANETYYFNATFKEPLNDSVQETIFVNSSAGNVSVPLYIDVTKNVTTVIDKYTQPNENNSSNITRQTTFYCSEMSGRVCPNKTACSSETVTSRDGVCCLGTCTQTSSGGSYAWIGYLIAGIVVLAIAFVWARYKKVKPAATPIQKAAATPGIKGP